MNIQASDPVPACRVCGNLAGNRLHVVREMMLGLREEFPYLECGSCGCLQLVQIPGDMAKYYPPNYYSFDQHGAFLTFLRRRRSRHAYGHFNVVGWMLSELAVPNDAVRAIRRTGVEKEAAILDVGCGSGRLLLDLAWLGFKNLTGVDPFLAKDISYPAGPKVFRRGIGEMEGEFDLIMLHHSFEHMDRPDAVMHAVYRLLKPGGQAIIRIPVASSFAWRNYGVHWINLDAPRHFYLHTFQSMELLTKTAGLQAAEIVHEGNAEQFWGSEQYAKDIPMSDPRSLKASLLKTVMAWPRLRRCQIQARELNKRGEADLLCFHYRKPIA
jgi:SAM-dependent methyltransferase